MSEGHSAEEVDHKFATLLARARRRRPPENDFLKSTIATDEAVKTVRDLRKGDRRGRRAFVKS